MKSTPRFFLTNRSKRLLLLTLVSLVAVAALVSLAVSANKANRAAKARAEQSANTKLAINPLVQDKQPNAPNAAVIAATLSDNTAAATRLTPGSTINYTATITNSGAASPADDATNLNFSAPLDANTTLVAGSVHASPIARNDTYNWVGNTQLDTAARALPAVTGNDVAVNAPGGTDTFTVTAIAGGATSQGGTVTLLSPSGAFTYTPPLGRPNIGDGASVNDTFTYTITNSADPSLTSTGTVTITLTGRVWYLQAGAAGDGRSNTPSSSPAAMSTAADKSTDVFYIFSNGASLNGPFSVDAGQQLLGQGVNLVVNAITLFTAGAAPTTTNTAGSCVALAGAPGNNTLSGFNLGNCTGGTAITGANVGTLNVSTMTINTNGGALDLTGVGAPTVSVVLGGLTATGGTVGVNLVGMNGTINLAGGTLSGASAAEFTVSGGAATVTYTGVITQNNAQRVVNVQGTTGGSVTLSGTITGGASSLGVHIGDTSAVNGNVSFTTLNLGTIGARMTNQAVTITNGGSSAIYSLGTVGIFTTGAAAQGIAATNFDGTINSTLGTVDSSSTTAINIDGPAGLTTLGMTLTRVDSAGGTANGISIQDTNGSFTVNGDGSNTAVGGNGTGGTISNKSGADGNNTQGNGVFLNGAAGITLRRMTINGTNQNHGIRGIGVSNFTLEYSTVNGTNGTSTGLDEGSVNFDNLTGSAAMTNCLIEGGLEDNLNVVNTSGSLNRLTVSGSTFGFNNTTNGNNNILIESQNAGTTLNFTLKSSLIKGARADWINVSNNSSSTGDTVIGGPLVADGNTFDNLGANHNAGSAAGGNRVVFGGVGSSTVDIRNNTMKGSLGEAIRVRSTATGALTGTVNARVRDNVIGVQATANSGSSEGSGIFAFGDGGSDMTIAITNNQVFQYNNHGIRLLFGDEINNGSNFAVTITGNLVKSPGNINTDFNGINLNNGSVGATDDFTSCIDIGGAGALKNDITGSGSGSIPPNNANLRLQQRFNTSVLLPGYAGPAKDAGDGEVAEVDTYLTGRNTLTTVFANNSAGAVGGYFNSPGGGACAQPSFSAPIEDGQNIGSHRPDEGSVGQPMILLPAVYQALSQPNSHGVKASETTTGKQETLPVGSSRVIKKSIARAQRKQSEPLVSHHAVRSFKNAFSQEPNAPTAGENVTLNTIATFPAGGKSITIKYSATVNTTVLTARQASTQGTITANGGAISVQTDDPDVGGVQATITLLDTTLTWTGDTSTDWNDAANWDRPGAVQSSYAPGVSNPAVNDVVIPNVGAQPTISTTDIGIYSLNISNGRTLTITNPRVLTIGGSPGGDLTLDGIISGGNLNLGTGAHAINNAGGTGSLSSTNVATVLSGGGVTLNNNLQAGALAVNAGGSMTIATRTLSLNGTGGLVVPGGATFTTTASTVIFNGTAAQQAAGIAYNNLTINNTAAGAPNALGATLAGNATINGVLALTSNDLNTGGFTLTQPNTTASTGAGDVVGAVARTGGPFGLISLTFGNPNNVITFTGAGTRPTTMTVVMAKAAPATYAAAVQRNYTMSQTGGSLFTATVRLHYLDSELNGNTPEANLGLRRFRTADSHWVAAPPPPGVPTRDGAANWIEATGVLAADLATQWTFSTLVPTASDGVVSGRIVDGSGNPVEGAVVRLEGTQNRKFITDANGFYRFDNVATNGFYTVTPSRANYSFTPSVRSFSQIGESTEAAFGATLSTSTLANPLDTPEYFVRQHYIDFLNREPDEAGFNFWSDQIIECSTDQNCFERRRQNVSAAFFLSIEFQRTGGVVDGVYRAAYGARPDFAHFLPDTRTVGNGVRVGIDGWETVLATNTEAFVNSFVNRAEFHAAYDNLSNVDYVDTLISHTGVSFTSAERDALLSGLGAGSMTRAQALRSIAENNSFVSAKFNETFVMMEYFGYLRRDPDASGFAFWLNKLNQFNGNFEQAEMVKAFIVSGEYRSRFPR